MPADAAVLRRSPIADRIRNLRLIAVLRRVEPRSELLTLIDLLVDDGVRAFEITFDGPTAAEDLRACRERVVQRGIQDAIFGAGTVRSMETLEAAHAAGADFAVSPSLDPAVLRRALDLALPFIPGAFSPTEVEAAWQAGATFVKLFPASSLGPTHARELRGPFPDIECVATGGIDPGNARAFLDGGCVAVGVGSAIVRVSAAERRALVAATTGLMTLAARLDQPDAVAGDVAKDRH